MFLAYRTDSHFLKVMELSVDVASVCYCHADAMCPMGDQPYAV